MDMNKLRTKVVRSATIVQKANIDFILFEKHHFFTCYELTATRAGYNHIIKI